MVSVNMLTEASHGHPMKSWTHVHTAQHCSLDAKQAIRLVSSLQKDIDFRWCVLLTPVHSINSTWRAELTFTTWGTKGFLSNIICAHQFQIGQHGQCIIYTRRPVHGRCGRCGVPVNSSHGQLVTAQNRMTSWQATETPCCDELTGASNAVLSLLWRVNRMLPSA